MTVADQYRTHNNLGDAAPIDVPNEVQDEVVEADVVTEEPPPHEPPADSTDEELAEGPGNPEPEGDSE